MKYIYILSENEPTHRLYTVGCGEPHTESWQPDSDWNDQEKAAQRAAYLNGNSRAVDPKGTADDYIERHAEVENIVGWAEVIMSALGAPDQHVNDIEVAFARRIIETDRQIKKHNAEFVTSQYDDNQTEFVLSDGTEIRAETVDDRLRIRCNSHGQMYINPVVANVIEITSRNKKSD